VEHRVRWGDGSTARLDIERWVADPLSEELDLLAGVSGPVLDVGCGPGRHVAAVAERGVEALGIDVLPEALRAARSRGAAVLERSVFADVPRAGEWATILLLDGNVGIGGDPVALMRRVRELLSPKGCALIELEAPGVGLQRDDGRLETPHGRSLPFAWGRVGVDGIEALSRQSGFAVTDLRTAADRWFAELTVDRWVARSS
jgi:SAM-dependent methyltransferase